MLHLEKLLERLKTVVRSFPQQRSVLQIIKPDLGTLDGLIKRGHLLGGDELFTNLGVGAQFELGVAYDRGVRGTQNYATAAMWYEKAAAQGFTEAIYNLGTLFDEGLGAPKDHVYPLQNQRLMLKFQKTLI